MTMHDVRELAAQMRVDSIRASTEAGSGHPTSSLSAADLMAVLLERHLRWDPARPDHPNRDHLVFSKGHASPLLYAMLRAVGLVGDDELLTYRRLGSRLEGHPVPSLPFVDVATGSLGQGLPVALGIALAAKRLEHLPYRVWVLLGDSEMSEGSIWEAFDHARAYQLDNLVAVLDMNRLGQRGETPLGWNAEAYAARAAAFGWHSSTVDGHDLDAIDAAYAEATSKTGAPTLVIARTLKGKGVAALENANGFHGKPLDRRLAEESIHALGGPRSIVVKPLRPAETNLARPANAEPVRLPRYDSDAEIATRKAYGDALVALGAARSDVVVLDAEVSNSTFADAFAKAHPERFFEMFIAEQQLLAAAVGMSTRGFVPFASTFAAFFTRAFDFVRMAAVSRANLRLCGSHAGVSVGEDGPSQMGLEDLAMMRAVHGSTVLHPCCGNQTARLVEAMAEREGIVYLRTLRGDTAVIYTPEEAFPIGGSKRLRGSDDDRATIVAAGITVHEALDAYERLRADGIAVRVIDAYSIKPLDRAGIRAAVRATRGRLVVVEDHFAEGGLGDAVRASLDEGGDAGRLPRVELVHLAVRAVPGSGTPSALRHAAGIDSEAIVAAVRDLIARERSERAAPRGARSGTACFICGEPATRRIAVAGEDDKPTEEVACDLHARGHRELAPIAPSVLHH